MALRNARYNDKDGVTMFNFAIFFKTSSLSFKILFCGNLFPVNSISSLRCLYLQFKKKNYFCSKKGFLFFQVVSVGWAKS